MHLKYWKIMNFNTLIILAVFTTSVIYPTEARRSRKSKKLKNTMSRGSGRIVGGYVVTQPWKYPFIMGITNRGARKSFCGSTLVNELYAVTAAHCLGGNPRKANLVASPGKIEHPEAVAFPVEEYIIHPKYSRDKHYDIGLVKLKKPGVIFNESAMGVRPLCLESNSDLILKPGDEGTVIGRGRTNLSDFYRETQYRDLREAQVKLASFYICKKTFPSVHQAQLCIDVSSGRNSGFGDSGGPFLFFNGKDSSLRLIGVVSGGSHDTRSGRMYGNLYTRVSEAWQWLRSEINKEPDIEYCRI